MGSSTLPRGARRASSAALVSRPRCSHRQRRRRQRLRRPRCCHPLRRLPNRLRHRRPPHTSTMPRLTALLASLPPRARAPRPAQQAPLPQQHPQQHHPQRRAPRRGCPFLKHSVRPPICRPFGYPKRRRVSDRRTARLPYTSARQKRACWRHRRRRRWATRQRERRLQNRRCIRSRIRSQTRSRSRTRSCSAQAVASSTRAPWLAATLPTPRHSTPATRRLHTRPRRFGTLRRAARAQEIPIGRSGHRPSAPCWSSSLPSRHAVLA